VKKVNVIHTKTTEYLIAIEEEGCGEIICHCSRKSWAIKISKLIREKLNKEKVNGAK
jgi:hypothetical protein